MIKIRRSAERGHFNHGWLDTFHTFSFASYYDPAHMGFRDLLVINEDRVMQGRGFGMHPHDNMEIITYIVEGALEHKDSMGNGSVIRRGDIQRMSAGTGILHSEFNPSNQEPVHLLQIWILPDEQGLTPEYEQRFISDDEKRGVLRLLASPDGRDGSVAIHQDVRLYASIAETGEKFDHPLGERRHAWVQLIRGELEVNGLMLQAGDGASISGEQRLVLSAAQASEFLLFDLP